MLDPLSRLIQANADKPRRFEIVAKAGEKEATVYLYDVIGGYDGINPAQFAKDLKEIKAETIHLRINSPGGTVTDARAIMTALSAHPSRVVAHVDGLAASSASLIMLAAAEIEASQGAFVMVHQPWGLAVGDAAAMRESAALLDKFSAEMVKDYTRRTGTDAAVVSAWMDAETWFTAEEAVTVGLVDRVVESVSPKNQWDLTAYAHAPAALVQATQVQVQAKVEPIEVPGIDSAPDSLNMEVHNMDNPIAGQTKTPEEVNAAVLAAVNAETARSSEINHIGAQAGMPQAAIQAAIANRETTVQAWQSAVLDELLKRDQAHDTRIGTPAATVVRDEADTRRAGYVQALLNRGDARSFPIKAGEIGAEQRSIVAMGLLRVAEECVRGAGKNPSRMDANLLVKAAMSTSDFPYLLGTTADVALKAGYGKAPQTWAPLAGRRTVNNFKLQSLLDVGMKANFDQMNETGEYKEGYMVEGKDTFRVQTYGQLMAFTRQTIINDELNALVDIPMQLGMKWAIKQSSLVWGAITANAAMFDGENLFSAAHANYISSGTAINVDNLGIARKTMRAQTDLGGDLIDIQPAYLVVPVGKEQLARQYMSSAFNPTAQTSINPWVGSLQIISEPRLDTASATAWYVFAEPGIRPVIVAVYLAGNEGIFSDFENSFETDGVKFKARMDFGVGVVDYRGAVLNAGA